jgi:transcription elongation GreA/GreB family factor
MSEVTIRPPSAKQRWPMTAKAWRSLVDEVGRRVRHLCLVFPGDGDSTQGWISADSPTGAAILGSGPGDMVEVIAPVGRRMVTVPAVDWPVVFSVA